MSTIRVTQQDIARIANVSQATVSRVLAGDEKVEDSLRDRVVAVMQAHNYRPDSRARSLRNRQTHLIGLVVNRPSGVINEDPFFSSLISGILDFLRGTPYHLCLDAVSGESGEASTYDELLRSKRVDGLILVESAARDQRLDRLQTDRFPFVLIGNPLGSEEIHSVDNDNVLAGESATRHLLDQGFKRVGILGGRTGLTVSDDRIAGYQRAIRGRQEEHLIWHSEFGLQAAKEVAFGILKSSSRPDALVVIDDFMAMGVMFAARELGMKAPTDLGLVSFNDTTLCALIDGGLSSMNLNTEELVRTACSRLLEVVEDVDAVKPERIIVASELKIRGSSLRRVGN